MRLIFMGTPHFALPTLKALHEAGHEIVAVYSQPPRPAGRGQKETLSPVHAYAAEHNLPVHTPVSLKDEAEQQAFSALGADAAVVVAYGLLLPKPILNACPLGCINVHPSALPRWRGAAPIQRTIMAGDKKTAICIMQMDEGLDTGDVLIKKEYEVNDSLDAGQLHNMLSEEAGSLVLQTLDGLKNGTITPEKQSEEGVTYAKKISKEECRIDWNRSAEEIRNHIRGLSPSPGACFVYNGEKIKLFDAGIMPSDKQFERAKPGEVLTNNLDVKCGKGILMLEELQRPGKRRMNSAEFSKGFTIPPRSILE